MITNNYLPIIARDAKQRFLEYTSALHIPQIDYFAIGVQNNITKKSISLMSRSEWQKHFTNNNYASHDPLRKAALHSKRNLIPFDEIDYVDNFGKEIMRQRLGMEIRNGIILMQRFGKFNYMITLGTDFSKFDAFNFIKQHHDKFNIIKTDLINLVAKEAKKFLPSGFLMDQSF